jgi:hypothetical protein
MASPSSKNKLETIGTVLKDIFSALREGIVFFLFLVLILGVLLWPDAFNRKLSAAGIAKLSIPGLELVLRDSSEKTQEAAKIITELKKQLEEHRVEINKLASKVSDNTLKMSVEQLKAGVEESIKVAGNADKSIQESVLAQQNARKQVAATDKSGIITDTDEPTIKIERMTPSQLITSFCVPPKTAGTDLDFKVGEDNPMIVDVTVSGNNNDRTFDATIHMRAKEKSNDNTTVEKNCPVTLYKAPEGYKIINVKPEGTSVLTKEIITQGPHKYPGSAGDIVRSFTIYGDREGDEEAGIWTKVEVEWNELEITLKKR